MNHNHVVRSHSKDVLSSKHKDWIHLPDSSLKKIFEWQHVSVEASNKKIVSDVDCWTVENELTCICGANGAGKTQLLRLGLEFLKPTSGKVSLLGSRPYDHCKQIGYVPQQKNFNRNFPATVQDVLVAGLRSAWPLFVTAPERDLAASKLKLVGGEALLDKDLTSLSGGELQRVFIARALILNPKILVLDEPMAAVDMKGRSVLMDLFCQMRYDKNVSIILITHSDDVVSHLADRVVFLEKGHLVGWGTPQQVLNISELREVAFSGHDHEGVIDGGEG